MRVCSVNMPDFIKNDTVDRLEKRKKRFDMLIDYTVCSGR